MKASKQYVAVELFIMLYKVVLPFVSVDEILKSESSEQSFSLFVILYKLFLTRSIMNGFLEWTAILLTHSLTLAHSLNPSLRCKLLVLDNSTYQCVRLSKSIAEKGDILKALL